MFEDKKAIEWAGQHLQKNGYTLQGLFKPVRLMPWSQVYRVLTCEGYIYLKQMSSLFSIESKVLFYLLNHNFKPLPYIIAIEESLNCFIMRDAGVVLRNILRECYQINLVETVFQKYISIQKKSIDHVENLLNLGVLDWRLSKLPEMYQALCHNLQSFCITGLEDADILAFQELYSSFVDLCHRLSSYSIPETLEHGDFQDNNVLIHQGQITLNDWGDCVISHPFFSLVTYLDSIERNHHLIQGSSSYHQLENIYLREWQEYESQSRLKECFHLTQRLYPIKFATTFFRVVSSIDKNKLNDFKRSEIYKSYQTQMMNGLKSFIEKENRIK